MRRHPSSTLRTITVSALAATSLAAACGDDQAEDGKVPDPPCGSVTPEERAQNQAVFDALAPSCAGCHTSGARGYFASIQAFESLLAYNADVVVPGSPDESELVRLLEGNGTRAFTQMPISGPTYAALAEQGLAPMPMADIRAWVSTLRNRTVDTLPSIEAPRVTRQGADEVVRGLYQQLGLSDEDFFTLAASFGIPAKNPISEDLYPMTSDDWTPGPYASLPAERHQSLGGGSALLQVRPDATASPSFLGTLTQVSQRWCKLALDKPGNTALLPAGATPDVGSTEPEKVKAVIAAWYLHFHAVVPSQAEIDAVYDGVFLPLEVGADPKIAYAGTCSFFIRHPDWIYY